MRRLLVVALLVAGCSFTPSYDPELACGPAPDRCPRGLVCSPDNKCVKSFAADAGVDDGGADAEVPITPQIIIAPTTQGATEGGPGSSFSVTLSAPPTSDVTVQVTSSDPTSIAVSPGEFSFSAATFDTPRMVTATAIDDIDLVNETVTINASGVGVLPTSATINVTDDDLQALDISPPAMLTVTEGMTGKIQVRLTNEPGAPVMLAISSNSSAATVSPTMLTFDAANFRNYQDVTVTAVPDANTTDETAMVSIGGAGLGQMVTVTVTDDDIQNISVSPSGTLSLVEEGAAGSLSVTLTQQPTTPVVVMVSAAPSGHATISPSMLTFTSTDYAMSHPVTVTPIADTDLAIDDVTITFMSPPLQMRTVMATILDNDTQAITVSGAPVAVMEGATSSFGVRLAFRPSGTVNVMLSSSDSSAATTTQTTLSFDAGNYATVQTVTVNGVDDPDAAGETVTMTLSSPGFAPAVQVMVTTTDNDTQSLQVTPTLLPLTEASGAAHSGTFMVRLAAMPGADVIVTPGAITPAGKVSIAPASLTFTALNYATQQSFTVTAQTDPDATDETLDFSLSATGGFVGSRAVRVTIIDNTFICNTTTCNAGCCLDNVCYPDGQADPFHCGAGAQMCQICGGTEFCNSGICLPM